MIPVIGTAVVKNPHWVERLYNSIDFPTEHFVIFNNNGKGEITQELENLRNIQNPFVENLHITHLPTNIGVSGAWNLIIKSFVMEPYWIITNDDVAFTPGLLEEMYQVAEDYEVGMVHPYGGDFGDGAWDLFLIKDFVIQKLGLFDENLYPAYCEDADYIMRIHNEPFKRVTQLKNRYLHGNGYADEYYEHGSQTKKTSQELTNKLDWVNITNFEYMNQKWGNDWRNTDPTKLPFNSYPLSYTSYDLDFVRRKYLGF